MARQATLDMAQTARPDTGDSLLTDGGHNHADNPQNAKFEIETTRSLMGTNRITKYRLEAIDDENADLATALESLNSKRNNSQLQHILNDMDLEDGDEITLGDILDHEHDPEASTYRDLSTPSFDADDVVDELRLVRFDPGALSVGDVIEVTRIDDDPKRGVVREVTPADDVSPTRAEITWDGHASTGLENGDPEDRRGFQAVRCGRGNMMHKIEDIRAVSLEDVEDEDLLDVRERVLEAADISRQAEALTVETDKSWSESGGVKADRASDLHARLSVSGQLLEEPVTVHVRNIFDAGWTASVEAELDEDLEEVVVAAARNNSPIPTGVRL